MQVAGRNLRTKRDHAKCATPETRLAQKWPSGSVFVLVHNDDHPHPGMNTTFPAGDSFWQHVGASRGSRFCLSGFHELVRRTFRLRYKSSVREQLRTFRSRIGIAASPLRTR